MSDIKKKIESCNSDKDVLLEYDYHKHHDEIARLMYKEKYEKMYQKKLEKEKQEIAKNLLDNNTDITIIAAATGLSIEKITAMKEN